jgi:hypothetical protein
MKDNQSRTNGLKRLITIIHGQNDENEATKQQTFEK